MFKIEPLKNLSNKKKQQQFVDSKINELISNENDRKFWDTLKSMNENSLSYNNITKTRPINFTIILHSAPDPNTLSAFQIHMLNDKKHLEDSNHLQSGFSLKINPLTQKPFYFPIQS